MFNFVLPLFNFQKFAPFVRVKPVLPYLSTGMHPFFVLCQLMYVRFYYTRCNKGSNEPPALLPQILVGLLVGWLDREFFIVSLCSYCHLISIGQIFLSTSGCSRISIIQCCHFTRASVSLPFAVFGISLQMHQCC